ncbi:CGG triplet repeat-binding protein 1, partial [Aphis craccivora]
MPKSKPLFSSTLQKYVNEFGADIFSTDVTILYCKVCEVRVSEKSKQFSIQQHVAKTSSLQTLISTSSNLSFNSDLCKTLLSANIPLNKLSKPIVHKFLEKYTNKSIPDQSTLRKTYVHKCYEDTLCEIRTYTSNKNIWISIDETTDTMGRYIANTIIGTLELGHPGKVFLLDSTVLEKTNSGTIVRLFEQSLSLLWPGGIQRENVLLFLSDAAPYMVKAGKALKLLYSKMEHVTCLVHALHRVAEEIRNIFPKVDDLISNVKKIFLKAPYRLQIFKTIAPNIPLPPQPILTRWGTWLNAVMYYSEHYVLIKQVIMELDREDAISIGKVQDLIADRSLECNLAYIKS